MEHKIHQVNPAHRLNLFGFLMITASMVVSIYIYPTFATSGLSAIFYLIIAGFLWFIPVCLVSAELATGGKDWCDAGVFSWGKAAFSERLGFFMIFLQWLQITIGFIAMLYFVTSGLGYALNLSVLTTPSLTQFFVILIIFWSLTFANFLGTRITKLIATYAFFIGILLPVIFLIILGVFYINAGNKINIAFSTNALLPDFTHFSALILLVSFILSYMGPEASAIHVNHLQKPERNYPLAILILVILTVILASLSSLTISMVIPKSSISLSGGIFECFRFLFNYYHIEWITYPFALIISLSAIGEVSSWINGPIQGIQTAAEKGLLPPVLAQTNKHHMPTKLLIIQGCVFSFWLVLITICGMTLGSGNIAFFAAMTLTVIVYLSMYALLFLSYIKLKISQPNSVNPRKFNLPSWFGISIAIIGLIFTVISFFISFAKPEGIPSTASYVFYLLLLIFFYLIVLIIPHFIYTMGKKHRVQWLKIINEKNIKKYKEKFKSL